MMDLWSLDRVMLLPELTHVGGFESLWLLSSLSQGWKMAISRVPFEWQPDGIRKRQTEMSCLKAGQLSALCSRFAQMKLKSVALRTTGPIGPITLHQLLLTSWRTLRRLCLYDCSHGCTVAKAFHLQVTLLEHGLPPNLFFFRLGGGLGGSGLIPLGKRREEAEMKTCGLGPHDIERPIRKLTWLALDHNNDLTTIAGLTRTTWNLKELYLDACASLVTLKGLGRLKQLETLSLRGCQQLPPHELHLMDRPHGSQEMVRDHYQHLALVVTEGCSLITDIPQWAWLVDQVDHAQNLLSGRESYSNQKRRPILEWHRHLPPYGILDRPWHALGYYEQRVLMALGSSEASWSRHEVLTGWDNWRYWELPEKYDPLPERDKHLWALLGWSQARWGKWGSTGWMPCLLRATRVLM